MGNIKLASLEHISDKVGKFLKNADVCGELLLHLINNILDTGKVEIGELEINPIAANMYNTIERIWNVCSELIRGKNLIGKIMIKSDMPKFLRVDPWRLTQIFMNLVGNAVKFTDRGAIIIKLEWINDMSQVEERCFEPIRYNDDDEMNEGIFEKNEAFSQLDENFCTLTSFKTKIEESFMTPRQSRLNKGILKVTINDTGLGMTKEDLSRLFQKFTQVSQDPSKRKLGTGLGLFITKELCERMKGQIKVFSKEGKGSCFIFCIPLTPVDQSTMIRGVSTQNIPDIDHLKSLKTMIADDDPFSQLILKNYFHKLHVQVTKVVENGLEAYKTYVAHTKRGDPLKLVTMDLTMPVMGGKEAAEKIRKYEVDNGMEACLLVISGNCSESEIAECTNRNGKVRANVFLKKPASIDELLNVISSLRESS